MAMLVSQRKQAGAYYTGSKVARFLADWAIRTPFDRVLEPCFGEGAFLLAAVERMCKLNGHDAIVGVDVDSRAWRFARLAFEGLELHNSDFFELSPHRLGLFDTVIGNPPFIRYHHFSGETRERALRCAAKFGVQLPALSSAWAPFLVHAAGHLRTGGRLAMVAPYEITYARYARPVVDFLVRSFAEVHCLVFEEPLFPELNENTVLLLCEGFGGVSSSVAMHQLSSVASLRLPLKDATFQAPVSAWATGSMRARLFDLPTSCSDLYQALVQQPQVVRLGEVADITIGYVTGGNDFFHLTQAEVDYFGLARRDLRMALRRGADLTGSGIVLTLDDAAQLASRGAHWLFLPQDPLSSSAASYVSLGENRRIDRRYKCIVRDPWYRVPGVKAAQMLLSVFSTTGPRLIANEAGVVATNSLLTVDRVSGESRAIPNLAAAAISTLSQLSAEVEGHALGGGALKFEPSEARRWALPAKVPMHSDVIDKIDHLLREGHMAAASAVADELFLDEGLGLDRGQLATLRDGLAHLRRLRNRSQTRDGGCREKVI